MCSYGLRGFQASYATHLIFYPSSNYILYITRRKFAETVDLIKIYLVHLVETSTVDKTVSFMLKPSIT